MPRRRRSPELLDGDVQGGADNRGVIGIHSLTNSVSTVEALSALHLQASIRLGRQVQP